jgi:fatty-acid peroxygenase
LNDIPRDEAYDNTLALLKEGYAFISRRCDKLGTDIFRTRLMLRKVICMRGAEAAHVFYGSGNFTRRSAMPPTTLRLLQDKGSVQLLDDAPHQHRKAMFLSLTLEPGQVGRLRAIFAGHWLQAIPAWQQRRELSLFDAVNRVLTQAVCEWAGVPLDEKPAEEMTRELVAMIENAGGVGPRTWQALILRNRSERFVAKLVERVRKGELALPRDAPLRIMAQHRNVQDNALDTKSAAVEVLNLLRPVVAVGRFIMFAAMALEEHRQWKERFAAGEEDDLESFAEEVRRLYPFFPFVGGRARQEFRWRDYRFRKGDWVLLDLHGTNHDPRRFPEPDRFEPGRGLSWKKLGYDFIPQGGGDPYVTHRCPGEEITVELMKEAVRLLTRSMRYDVPEQNLFLDSSRMPARPERGFRISNIRASEGR